MRDTLLPWAGKFSVDKDITLPQFIYGFNITPNKIPASFFKYVENLYILNGKVTKLKQLCKKKKKLEESCYLISKQYKTVVVSVECMEG